MFKMTRRGSAMNIPVSEFVCDTVEDLLAIPTDSIVMGSTAVIISTSAVYKANSQGLWVKQTTSGGGGGGGGMTEEEVQELINSSINALKGDAPADLDTLGELATAVKSKTLHAAYDDGVLTLSQSAT